MTTVDASRSWRVDFFALWTVQFVASAGFSVAHPFIPLYIQELGVSGVREAAVWAGIIGAAGGLTLAVSSPIWGAVADRYGRKLMVERATVGAAVFQVAMGLANSVPVLALLRTAQSLVSGVQAAVMALAATIIPRQSLGLAMGTLQTATALGSTLGPVIGGILAAQVGYRSTFFVTGAILFLAGLLCWVAVHEDFQPVASSTQKWQAVTGFRQVLAVPGMGGLLILVMLSRAAAMAMSIAIPLRLQEMAGGSLAVSGEAGTIIGLTAMATAGGAVLWGRLGDRVGQARTLMLCLILSALIVAPQALVYTPWQLALGQMAYAFCLAGLIPTATALVGIIGPQGRQGVVYGANGTALALGNALGPSLAAALIGALGTRAMFVGIGLLLFLLHVTLKVALGPAYSVRTG